MQERILSSFFSIPLRIWIMSALILNPSSMGQTTCLVMSEPSFWNGTRSKKTKFSAISRNSWPTAWMMLMCWGRHAVHLEICFWNWSRWTPFSRLLQYHPFVIRCSVQCSWNVILWVLSREGVIVWETASLLKHFNGWRTLVGHETMLLTPGMGGSFAQGT